MVEQELKKARKSGSSIILSSKSLKPGREYHVYEISNPMFSDNKCLVISERSNEPSIDKFSESSPIKFSNKSKAIITREGIEEFKTTDGRLIMRRKHIKARREATSTLLSLTGFIEAGKYYMITDLGSAIHIKEFVSSDDKIQAEFQEAKRQIHTEIDGLDRNNTIMKK